MSQYVSEVQRFYHPTYEYPPSQSQYFVLQSQRNPPIREVSLNRNNSVSSSLILKPGKIQQNVGGKIRREKNMRNSVDLKENDPNVKNSQASGHINKGVLTPKDQSDYAGDYEQKNTYWNPLIVKREKNSKDFSRQKILNTPETHQTLTQSIKSLSNSKDSYYQQQYDLLNEKVSKIELQMKESANWITENKKKIQKLEECYRIDTQREQIKKNTRSISNLNSGSVTFKELSDIMSLIEETKNYQMKNSEEYRKMIEEFRSTILQFREELNKTPKKHDIDSEIQKIKLFLNCDTSAGLSRKSSIQYTGLTLVSLKTKESEAIEKLEKQIQTMKASMDKLQEQNTSIKADMAKISVRDKNLSEEISIGIGQLSRKLQNLQKQINPFSNSVLKKGQRYEGFAICFKVTQQLTTSLNNYQEGLKPSHMTHSSVVEYVEGSKLGFPGGQSLTVNEKIYFIDKDGYLLDKDNCYLMNERNQQIRLSKKEIDTLRKLKVLE